MGGREESLPNSFKYLEDSDVSGCFPDLGSWLDPLNCSTKLSFPLSQRVFPAAIIDSPNSHCVSEALMGFLLLSAKFLITGESQVQSLEFAHFPFALARPSQSSTHPSLLSNTINLLQQSQKSFFPLTLSFDSKNKAWHRVLGCLFPSAIAP